MFESFHIGIPHNLVSAEEMRTMVRIFFHLAGVFGITYCNKLLLALLQDLLQPALAGRVAFTFAFEPSFPTPTSFLSVVSRDSENVMLKRGKWDSENVAFPLPF